MATPRAAQHRDLEQRLRNLEDALAGIRAVVARRPKFELSSGDLTIDGGDVLMLDTDGSVMFRLGAQEFGDRGLSLFRENGTAVLELKRAGESPLLQQAWSLKDGQGNTLVSEWAFGSGLSRPRIHMPVVPAATPAAYGVNGPEVSTTSGTFVTAFRCDTRQQNPLYQPVFAVRCSDTTTAAEVQVTNDADGTLLDGFFTGPDYVGVVAAGTTAVQEVAPVLNMPGGYDQRVKLNVQVRRTAGAGTVFVAVPHSIGG